MYRYYVGFLIQKDGVLKNGFIQLDVDGVMGWQDIVENIFEAYEPLFREYIQLTSVSVIKIDE